MTARHRSHAPLSSSLLFAVFAVLATGGCDKPQSEDRREARPAYAAPGAGEDYAKIEHSEFIEVDEAARSTFSIDVDTAAYSNVRRFLARGQLPPVDAVRVEELINYFDYDYPQPSDDRPFSVTTEIADCPWTPGNRLVHIGLQGRELAPEQLPPRNLVFLLDVSGSMQSADKLPLVKRGLALLVDQLDGDDRVALVAYGSGSWVALPPTSASERGTILDAINQLEAGGATNGSAGIETAYALAHQHFDDQGINRVVLATDGDFNVGVRSRAALERLIEHERETGVSLTVLGFGSGNLKDATMETLADKGNGNYAYIDSLAEARKVLVHEAGGTLVTLAKDVKIQVEFNPRLVESYRLIGYENRTLDDRDFADDDKDAGEIGAGHSVTALYEVVPAAPAGPSAEGRAATELRYQGERPASEAAASNEMLWLALRYKAPHAETSELLSMAVEDGGATLEASSDNFRFAASVAEFGLLLRGDRHDGQASWASARALAEGALGTDSRGYRAEFLALLDRAAALSRG